MTSSLVRCAMCRVFRCAVALVPIAFVLACGDGGGGRAGGACGDNLLAGDLVITEVFAAPAGTDDGKEWIEIYNATSSAQQLAGVLLSTSREDGSSLKDHTLGELTIEPMRYAVLGNMVEDARPEYVDYAYGDELELGNTAGAVAIGCEGGAIDSMFYGEATEATSRGFDGTRTPDAAGNDELSAWCDATTQYQEDLIGTPGSTNDSCSGTGLPTVCLGDDGVERPLVPPGVGSLVISEFHADPMAVEEADGEWFEIYVAADADLNGVEFGKSLEEDGRDGGLSSIDCIHATAGSYLVIARNDDEATNGGIAEVAGLFDFGLGNSGEQHLYLFYGADVIDEISWNGTEPGAAKSLDPDYLDAVANDEPSTFCDAITPYGAGDLGTPGAANDAQCAIAPPEGQCFDGSGFVDVVAPAPGELVITEFHADPGVLEDDEDGEWFEVRANAPVHLNGLELGTDAAAKEPVRDTIEVEDCIELGVGDYALVARNADAATNGGLPAVDATFGFPLGNNGGGLFIASAGTVIDEIAWTGSTTGAATSLDGTFTSATDNDDEANWCAAVDAYGDGDLGTPGEENPQCGGTTPSMCDDGGTPRMVVPPAVGDVVITELMPDPSAVADAEGEWFEVLVTADIDLNGLQLGTDPSDFDVTLPTDGACIAVTAGTRVVFAQNDAAASNGGIGPVLATFSFGLANGGGTLSVGYVGEALDTVTWSGSDPGTAISLDPEAEDAVANDDQGNFCSATTPYGDGDLGTPGTVGDDCGGGGGEGMCDDGGTPRAINAPVAGDLVINEVMANPALVTDANGEWFEVVVTANVDLNGLQLSSVDGMGATDLEQTIDDDACLEVAAGTHLLFARNATPDGKDGNGGLPEVDYVFGFGLTNSNAGVAVGVADTVLDAVSWASVPTGASRSLDPGSQDPVANDADAVWCPGVPELGGPGSDNGTPGAANDAC